LHIHWGGQYAGVDVGRFPVGEGDVNAGVYEIVEVLDSHRLRIRPAATSTRSSVYPIGRSTFSSFRVGNVESYVLDTRSMRDLRRHKESGQAGHVSARADAARVADEFHEEK
jgi:hypothetical protein